MRAVAMALMWCAGLGSVFERAHAQDAFNGCTFATAVDDTAMATVSIAFGGALGQNYSPKCVRVAVGTGVVFSGVFSSHPLEGGTVVANQLMPASSGPFIPATSSGASRSFVMATNGIFPYYCQVHGRNGMNGVVYVGPLPPPVLVFADGFETP
jgi:plastocyanin